MYWYFSKLLVFLFDFVFLNAAFASVFWLRFKSGLLPESFDPSVAVSDYTTPMLALWAYWFLIFLGSGLYRNWTKESRFDQAYVVFRSITLGVLVLFLATGYDQIVHAIQTRNIRDLITASKAATLFQYWVSLVIIAVADRVLLNTGFKWLLRKGIGANRVLVIGANESGEELRKNLDRYPGLGHRVIGYVDDDGRKKGKDFDGLPVFGTYSDLPELCARLGIHSVIISKVSSSPNEISKIIRYCAETHVTIHMEPDLMDVIKGHLKTHQLYGYPLLVLLPEHMPEWQANMKRLMDLGISFAALFFGFPVWMLVALAVKLDSPGPVVFRQERVGRNGRPFMLRKFRTMVADAEKKSGPVWAGKQDPRITRVGRILRKSRLDEIPQLVNVLKGEMSVVGPRPERQYFVEKLKEEIPVYARRMKMKPGLTGWAQVKHHYDENIEDVRKKVMFDLYYFENMSLRLDLKILLLSVWVVLTGKGAH